VFNDEFSAATSPGWAWDPSLYSGSARFYPLGRVDYPDQLVDELVVALGLNGTGRLLDVGCGPGSLTLLLAPHVAEAIGIDADGEMLTEAANQADRAGVRNVIWRHLRAEQLPSDIPPILVATFAQSFHWLDRHRVAAAVRGLLVPGGAVVHMHATTHEGIDTDARLPHPRPPRAEIVRLVQSYLGTERRAGQGVLASGTPEGEDAIYRAAGFSGPQRLEVPGRVVERSVEEVVASVYSLSSSAPHLFGDRLERFDADLRQLLDRISRDGGFSEQMREIAADIWR
jgi:SAM-dependent methyltransferase